MKLRPARLEDAERLLKWRNDPLTCAMSRTPEPVAWEGHVGWLKARLSRPEPWLFIAEEEGEPVGTIRIDGEELSYTVAPEHRGKGFAIRMLTIAREQFGAMTCEIKPSNPASIAAATRAGHKVVLI